MCISIPPPTIPRSKTLSHLFHPHPPPALALSPPLIFFPSDRGSPPLQVSMGGSSSEEILAVRWPADHRRLAQDACAACSPCRWACHRSWICGHGAFDSRSGHPRCCCLPWRRRRKRSSRSIMRRRDSGSAIGFFNTYCGYSWWALDGAMCHGDSDIYSGTVRTTT